MKALISSLKIILLSGVFLFCFYLPLLSQSAAKIDSLLAAANKEDDPATEIELYFKSASEYN